MNVDTEPSKDMALASLYYIQKIREPLTHPALYIMFCAMSCQVNGLVEDSCPAKKLQEAAPIAEVCGVWHIKTKPIRSV